MERGKVVMKRMDEVERRLRERREEESNKEISKKERSKIGEDKKLKEEKEIN